MADNLAAVLTAIKTKTLGSALETAVSGNCFSGQAPARTAFPYVTWFNIPNGVEYLFNGVIESFQVQFDIFAESDSDLDVATIGGYLTALFDDCSLSISGWTHIMMKRLMSPEITTEDITTRAGLSTVKHWSVDYEIQAEA